MRPQHVTSVLTKQLSKAEAGTKTATAVDESLSKQQKALVLRQQLASINAELQRLEFDNFDLYGIGNALEDENEPEAPACRVAALHPSTEIRCNAAEDSSARDGQKENERRASIKVGEAPMLVLSPASSEVQRARKAAKAIRAPNVTVRSSFDAL